jgi:hypothetical protein
LKRSVLAFAALLSFGCRAELAQWMQRSEGTVALGYFDVVLPSESLRFRACTAYYIFLEAVPAHCFWRAAESPIRGAKPSLR